MAKDAWFMLGIILVVVGVAFFGLMKYEPPAHAAVHNILGPVALSGVTSHSKTPNGTTSGIKAPSPSPAPTKKPISLHNLYAANPDFIKGLDDECQDDNQKQTKQGYHVGMWAFSGPDSHGHVHVWCKGYYLHGNTRVWWDGVDTTEADDYVVVVH